MIAGLALVRVRGGSMHPTLACGDVILAQRLDRPPRVGEVVLARAGHGLLVKRVAATSPAGVRLGVETPWGTVPAAAVVARVVLAWTPGGALRRVSLSPP